MIYSRYLADVVRRKIRFFPALLLVGPRQSGKTTLAKWLGKEGGMHYASFDDISALAAVQLDPIGYLRGLSKPLILDEVQRAPELFLSIKADIDENREAGRYFLTGSANPLVAPKLGDALTGRMTICHMWPLSQAEISGSRQTLIDTLFTETQWPTLFSSCEREDLMRRVFVGGFPSLQTAPSAQERREWCNDYLSLSLQKDIHDLSQIEGVTHLPALLYGLAARVGCTINIEEISRITRTSSTSIRRYLQLLESLFLLYRLPSWSPNIDKRLTKSPKVYFSDTALLLHVLDFDEQRLSAHPPVFGYVLENFVVMECVKQATWSNTSLSLYHYRQEREKGTEVDLVLEATGKVVGIEIKLSAVVRSDDLRGLKALKQAAGDAFQRGVILYTGDRLLSLGDKMYALPLSALWS